MKYVRSILHAVAAVAAFAPFAPIVRTQAQARPEIQHIASQAAKKISKTQPHTILTTPLAGCLGAPDLCEEFDGALRAVLDKTLPGVQFIGRENALRHLANHGFLSVDAYLGALDNVASDAGAMTVTEQGTVEDATALGAVDEGLARASVETVRGWHLHAAIGPDGKPFRARVPVEVDFRLLPR